LKSEANRNGTPEARAQRAHPLGLVIEDGAGTERMCWHKFGSGPPLVLLHGGHGSWRHWWRNVEALGARHTLWIPDLPGFGDSSMPDCAESEDTLAPLVTVLARSLDRLLGNSSIAVAGFSFGAMVASCLAHRRSVDRLALLGPGRHGLSRRPAGELKRWRDIVDATQRREVFRHNLRVHMLHRPDSVDEMAIDIHAGACDKTRCGTREVSLSGRIEPWLGAVRCPVLIVFGEHDVTGDPSQVGPLLSDGHANRTWEVIRDAGHWVQYEEADQVSRRLAQWFSA